MGMTLTQAIKTYSLAPAPSKIPGSLSNGNDDTTLLQQIVSLINEGATALAARQYQDAIADYRAAESLIYSQIDPQWDPHVGLIPGVQLPRDADLFTPLLSSSSQWLNVLSVPTPTSPVRPLLEPPVSLPLATTELHGAGLVTPAENPTATAEAVSDIRLATIYSSQGNAAASDAASARAATEDQATASELAKAAGLPTNPVRGPQRIKKPAPSTTNSTAAEASVSVLTDIPAGILTQRQAGIVTGTSPAYTIVPMEWSAASAPDVGSITAYLYEPHVTATSLPDAVMIDAGLAHYALTLPYYYFYVILVGLAQAYQALGDYQHAISQYLIAAQYAYINAAVEGPYIWVQLATCYLAWGDVYYQQDDTSNALAQYSNVLLLQGASPAAPSTPLYALSSLAAATTIANQLIPELPALAKSGIASLSSDDTLIATVLLQVYGRLSQLNSGLDFWGNYQASVPIWTFDYLQQVAVNFAQLAVQSEQQVINFWTQAQQAQLTAAQLQSQVAQTSAQVIAARQTAAQAQAQANAYLAASLVAELTAANAQQNANEYAAMNSLSLQYQAWSELIAAGQEQSAHGLGYPNTPQQLESSANSYNTRYLTFQIGDQWQAGLYSQQYQTDSLQRASVEAEAAATQAQQELTAANAQVLVANANVVVAQLQASGAAQALQVFDADTFTPQVWLTMGSFMLQIYQGYMNMALAAAKLMEKAYNFENDTTITYIQDSYSGVVDGLLGADALMADIQEFSYDIATTTRGKLQLVKTSISLATNYGYLFNTQLVQTGSMSFQTSLDDFDSQYPGIYQGRIKSVSLQLQGIVPASGVSGTLTNGGISWYRLPSDIATDSTSSKMRIQGADTLVLSDYNPGQDGVLDSSDGPQLGIFEGAGVASTWTLSIPPSLNDIDYGSLTDVVLTFLYEVRFDPQLVPTVLADLAARPGWYSRQRAIPLAWLYPDLFYAFQSSGTLTLSLGAGDFPFNQTSPVVTDVAVLLSSTTAASVAGVNVSLCPPGKAAATAVTNVTGAASSQTDANWTGLDGGSVLGNWVIAIDAADNPGLVSDGQLNLSVFNNMTLMFDYTFTPRT
jgi:hypothetical protein